MNPNDILARVREFELAAHRLLGAHETAQSRVVLLEQTYGNLDSLAVLQDDLFRQALRCVEYKLFRAAHVMAWAAFVDFLQQQPAVAGMAKIQAARPKWRWTTVEGVFDSIPEFQLVEICRDVSILTKAEAKALQGSLSRRNECAHPGEYFPGLNETLGYISELLARLKTIEAR